MNHLHTRFLWRAQDSLELTHRGIIRCHTEEQAIQFVSSKGLRLISVHAKAPGLRRLTLSHPKVRLKPAEVILFTRQLAGLMAADISAVSAMATLATGSSPNMRNLSQSLQQSLNSGLVMSEALGKHPQVFNPFYLTIIRAGEASGALAPVLMQLADNYERSAQLRRKVRQALLQPALILATALIVAWLLLTQVMPEFASLYAQQNQQLPELTRQVLAISKFLIKGSDHSLPWLSLVAVVWLLGHKLQQRLIYPLHFLLLKLPLLGALSQFANTTEACRTLATTLNAGVPLLIALPHASNACRNLVFRKTIENLCVQLEDGVKLSSAIARTVVFPPSMAHMIRLGEESGRLGEVLEQAKSLYETELHRIHARLMPLIEPLLMLLLGIFVGGLILAMYLPVFAMGNLFQP